MLVWSSKGCTARTCEHTAALNANLADAAASVSPLPRQAGIPGRRMTWGRHGHDGVVLVVSYPQAVR